MRFFVCLFFGICGASAAHDEEFHYKISDTFQRPGQGSCSICFGDFDCLHTRDKSCQYYHRTTQLLDSYDDEGSQLEDLELKEQVDSAMYDLMEYASSNQRYEDCIPFVSQYTDCTKENICTGCNTCNCDLEGTWVCAAQQRCRPRLKVTVDHQLLKHLEEKLRTLPVNEGSEKRKKRSNADTTNPETNKTFGYRDITGWLYGINGSELSPNNTVANVGTHVSNGNQSVRTNQSTTSLATERDVTEDINSTIDKTNTEYIDFVDVLNNIAKESEPYNRQKLLLSDDNITGGEKMDKQLISNASYNTIRMADYRMSFLNAFEEYKDDIPLAAATEVVIDLLNSIVGNDTNATLRKDKYFLGSGSTEASIKRGANRINKPVVTFITKRNVIQSLNTSTEPTNLVTKNTMNKLELKNNVLNPLDGVIRQKTEELEDLQHIRQKLFQFMKTYNEDDFPFDPKGNVPKYNYSTYCSVVKLKIIPPLYQSGRRKNEIQVPERYLYKLKRDIYTILKDIAAIKKISKQQKLPKHFIVLIRALKFYIHKDNKEQRKEKSEIVPHSLWSQKGSKRTVFNEYASKSFQDILLDIIDIINTGMPLSNALGSLSDSSRKIITRIILGNSKELFTAAKMPISKPYKKIFNELKSISKEWILATDEIIKTSAVNQSYGLKLLHIMIMIDIYKMEELLIFFYNDTTKRMSSSVAHAYKNILETIKNNISTGRYNIHNFLLLKDKVEKQIQRNKPYKVVPKIVQKEESFIKKLKTFFKKSKNHLKKLLHKKDSKNEIIKKSAPKTEEGTLDYDQ